MIEAAIFLVLFYIVYRVLKGSTYKILLVAAFVNFLLYPFTSEYSILIPASIDFVTISLLIANQGEYWKPQANLLGVALICHLLIEIDRVVESNLIFDNYGLIITIITVGQLLVAGNAVINRLFERLWDFNDMHFLRYSPYSSIHKKEKE